MSELLIAILGVSGTLLSGIIFFVLGQRAERQKQSLVIRSEMLIPIEEWLKGAEKMVGILGDTVSAIALNLRSPVNYNLDERRKASNFMSENTNLVIGILDSKGLQTKRTKKLASELEKTIKNLDQAIKYHLLPLENEIVSRANASTLTKEFMVQALHLKLQIDSDLQKAYKLISNLKTSFT